MIDSLFDRMQIGMFCAAKAGKAGTYPGPLRRALSGHATSAGVPKWRWQFSSGFDDVEIGVTGLEHTKDLLQGRSVAV